MLQPGAAYKILFNTMPKLPFKVNFHIAKKVTKKDIQYRIDNRNKAYPVSKYLLFIRDMLAAGWRVKLYEVKASKYVFIYNDSNIYKVRFSNHKPLFSREMKNDCDFYAGVSNQDCMTTDEIKNAIVGCSALVADC